MKTLLFGNRCVPAKLSWVALVFLMMIFLSLPAQAQWVQQQKLLGSSGAAFDQYGNAVSISGNWAVVGSTFDDEVGFNAGAAYIYRFNSQSEQWEEEQKLLPDSFINGWPHQFGSSVHVDADVIVVGNRRDDDAGEDAGAVYVYRYNTSTSMWEKEQKLTASNGVEEDHFGSSVSVSNNVILVGAFLSDVQGNISGAAYVYRYDAGAALWLEEQMLVPVDLEAEDQLGKQVSIFNDFAILGANGNDDLGNGAGAAYIYKYNPTTLLWEEKQKIVAHDGSSGDGFGARVSISSNTVFVGAPNDDDSADYAGSAYAFRYDANAKMWIEEGKFLPDNPVEFGSYGASVSVSGDMGIVGHMAGGTEDFAGEAIVYRYESATSQWVKQQTLNASDAALGDQFGIDVAISEGQIIIGANVDDDNGDASGSAYVFTEVNDGFAVTGFTLVDAGTDQVIPGYDPIPDGAVLHLGELPKHLNVRANTVGSLESIRFFYTGKPGSRTENVAPYALFGDAGGNYHAGRLRVGAQSITATPYTENGAQGDAGKPVTLTFTVVKRSTTKLGTAYPNPFNPTTTIQFTLPEAAAVSLVVYDMLGREVKRLVDGELATGNHEVVFDAGNLPSGMYVYQLITPGSSFTKQMLLMK